MNPVKCPFDHKLLTTLLLELSQIVRISPTVYMLASRGSYLDKVFKFNDIKDRSRVWCLLKRTFTRDLIQQFPMLYEMIVYFVHLYRYHFKMYNRQHEIAFNIKEHLISAKYDCNTEILYRKFPDEPSNTIKKLIIEHKNELDRLLNMKGNKDVENKLSKVEFEYPDTKFDIELRMEQAGFDIRLLMDMMQFITQCYINICISLKPLNLPDYVVMWILDWLDYTIGDAYLEKAYNKISYYRISKFQGFDVNRNNKSSRIHVFSLLTYLQKIRIIEKVRIFHDS